MGDILKTPIIEEVEQSFLDYSLSVITDRAIPSAEDGLKPVVRRILWDMWDKGYKNDKKFVKCAQPVGDTMGRFHTKKMEDSWKYHMKNIYKLYPDIHFNTTTILTADCIEKYLNNEISFKSFI